MIVNWAATKPVGPGIVVMITQFVAHQVHLLDDGETDAWAATFTSEGEFASPTYPEPARGPAQLAGIARAYHRHAADAGERHRHATSDLTVRQIDADTLAVRATQLILASAPGRPARVDRVITMTDVLDRTVDGWRTLRKHITRDDHP
jgi:3-phenylpropionate/cinnamic acid dioxygenase small subunit